MSQSLHLMKLSDENLHFMNHKLASRERALLKEIIDHLRETERRRLFAKYGYSSLFEYVTRELKCCAGSAQIRIDAMRFASDVPEVREKLACGEVSLSTVATLQKFIRNERKYKREVYSQVQKKNLFAMAVGKSRRETEEALARIAPQSVPRREEIRPVNEAESKMTLIISDDLLKKIRRLKEVLPEGHGNTISDVIEKAVAVALKKYDPLLKRQSQVKGQVRLLTASQEQEQAGSRSPSQSQSQSQSQSRAQDQKSTSSDEVARVQNRKRPYISVSEIKYLHQMNHSKCSFVSRATGRQCDEAHSLPIEHKIPFAKGGTSDRENLTLLCPAHQRVRALEEYGEKKMRGYLERNSWGEELGWWE